MTDAEIAVQRLKHWALTHGDKNVKEFVGDITLVAMIAEDAIRKAAIRAKEAAATECQHDERFKGVLFAKNGCITCELGAAKLDLTKVASLVHRIRDANDLHAVFTIKDSPEFSAVSEIIEKWLG